MSSLCVESGTRVVSETAFAFFCLRFLFLYLRFLFFFFVCVFFFSFLFAFSFCYLRFVLCVWALYTKQYLSYLPYLTCFMQPSPCPWGIAQSSVIATRFSSLFLGFRCRYGASELHPVASFIGGNKLTLGAKFHYCNSITTLKYRNMEDILVYETGNLYSVLV